MTPKKQGPPKRWRSKEAREIAAAVGEAGGTVELTSRGHLRITGPRGVAIAGSAPGGGRALANTLVTIERETGLPVTHQPQESKRPDKKPAPGPRPQARQERCGEITRWNPGETCGFITDAEDRSWFVSRDNLLGGLPELPEGTRVTFTGSLRLKPGKRYPEALRVQAATPRTRP